MARLSSAPEPPAAEEPDIETVLSKVQRGAALTPGECRVYLREHRERDVIRMELGMTPRWPYLWRARREPLPGHDYRGAGR
jgi:hypothetical protein